MFVHQIACGQQLSFAAETGLGWTWGRIGPLLDCIRMRTARVANQWPRSIFATCPSAIPGFVAVDRLNLTVPDREFLVLLGPSGCGKTTTMRMIAGLETVTEGDILIGGARVNDLDPRTAMWRWCSSPTRLPQHDGVR